MLQYLSFKHPCNPVDLQDSGKELISIDNLSGEAGMNS